MNQSKKNSQLKSVEKVNTRLNAWQRLIKSEEDDRDSEKIATEVANKTLDEEQISPEPISFSSQSDIDELEAGRRRMQA